MTAPVVSPVVAPPQAPPSPDPDLGKQRSFRPDWWIVAALVALAAGLRAPNLGRAYWVDEGICIGIASHPLRQIPSLLRTDDGSPPLFYLLLHFWISIFGASEVATHCLPLVISLAVTVLAYWSGRTIFGRPAGLAAAALTATNPFLGWYSTETRMYPLVCAFAVVGLTFTVLAVRTRQRRHAAAAILSAAALLYTHNWGIYLVGVTLLVLAVNAWRARDRWLLTRVVAAGVAIAVLYLPWLPSFMVQAHHTAAPWAVHPLVTDFVADPASALGGTLNVIVAPLLVVGAWWTRRGHSPRDGRTASFLVVVGLGTAAAGWLAAQIQPSWAARYLAVIVAPLLLAAAGAMATSRRGQLIIATTCAMLAVWSIVGSVLPDPDARYAKSNVAAVAAAAAPFLRPGDVVVVTQTEQLAVLAHYLPPGLTYVTPTGPVSDPHVVNWYDLVPRLQRADVCETVGPSIDALANGADVLEINPLRQLGESGTAWYQATNSQVRNVDYLLGTDPALRATRTLAQASDPKPYSAVIGELFVKTGGPTPCHLPS